MSKQVIVLKGLPASGKSTWAKEQVAKYPGRYKRISKDDLRAMFDNSKWSRNNEKFVINVRNSLILLALQEGYHVLVDDTNLHTKHEKAIRELVKDIATVEIQDFTHVPLEECIARDQGRANYVGEKVIRRMYRDFLQQEPAPLLPYNKILPDAVICDLDGTLALLNGRNPYDASRCEEDGVNHAIRSIVSNYYKNDCQILLVSGRNDIYREQTERWLQAHSIPYHQLSMRKDKDMRKDSIIKKEIYTQSIQGSYNVLFVLDDRNQVVELWRSLGLVCLQVAEGDF